MKRYILSIMLVATLFVPQMVSAQMEIDDPDSSERSAALRSFGDSIKVNRVEHSYSTAAMERHRRQLIRQERNQIDVTAALQGSMTNLSESWIETSGGDNTITLLATIYAKHVFTKNNFSVESNLTAKFGYYRMVLESTDADGATLRDPVWFKNQDELQLSVTPSIKFSDNWSYGATVKFRSQFANGYLSNASQESYNLKSKGMSPGYLDISGGMIYKCPNENYPFTISMSPVAMSATYVRSELVRDNAQYQYLDHDTATETYNEPYGVIPYNTSNYEGGSSVQIDFEKSFGRTRANRSSNKSGKESKEGKSKMFDNNFLKYVTTIYSFYGWMTQIAADNVFGSTTAYEAAIAAWNSSDKEASDGIKPMLSLHPTVRWENRLEIKASRLLTTTLNFQLYYNRAQNYKIQTQTLLSVGLSYNFASK